MLAPPKLCNQCLFDLIKMCIVKTRKPSRAMARKQHDITIVLAR